MDRPARAKGVVTWHAEPLAARSCGLTLATGCRRDLHGGDVPAALRDPGHRTVHGRRAPERRTGHRPGSERRADHAPSRSAGGCRPGPPASRLPPPCRNPSCGTSATATRPVRTPAGCSSSARPRDGVPRQQVMDPYYATNAFYDALVKVPATIAGNHRRRATGPALRFPARVRPARGDGPLLRVLVYRPDPRAAGLHAARTRSAGDPAPLPERLSGVRQAAGLADGQTLRSKRRTPGMGGGTVGRRQRQGACRHGCPGRRPQLGPGARDGWQASDAAAGPQRSRWPAPRVRRGGARPLRPAGPPRAGRNCGTVPAGTSAHGS